MLLEQLDIESAMLAKERGQDLADRNSDLLWKASVERAIQQLARRGLPFNADDIAVMVPNPPAGYSKNAVGSCITRAARSGLIRQVGYSLSKRPESHSNLLRTWLGR